MKNNFDLLVFDWDGTLIDSIGWIVYCIQNAARNCRLDVPTEQAARDVIGLSLNNAMQQLFPDIDQRTRERFVACYSESFFSRKTDRDDLFDGIYDMLVQLQDAGYQLAVATGKTRKGLDKALQATGTGELFTITRCADETASKPEPVMLQEITRQLKIPGERALMIGDSAHDMQMAANAGIPSVAVSCGAHTPEILKRYNPLYCLKQTTEILGLL